jgi:LuxR family transcriptional regulator, maltose regulon positive regulatory protein
LIALRVVVCGFSFDFSNVNDNAHPIWTIMTLFAPVIHSPPKGIPSAQSCYPFDGASLQGMRHLDERGPMIELLTTKLFIPRPRKNLVCRPRLVDRLNSGLDRKLTLIAAPAGFGKTTLLSEWIPQSPRCVTWFSLDEGDDDPVKFWAYFIASLQGLQPEIGASVLSLLQSSQPPPMTSILTALINEITAFKDVFAIVLDDYHIIDSQPIHEALTFLIDHLPKNMHLVITTRIDPPLPLARLRVHDDLTELRANELRFTLDETARFLKTVMGLNVSTEEVAVLEARTEGWIAGLQIAALSMQGRNDITGFIQAFSGSHRHILGYLADEVINQQSEGTLKFLLQTSLLDRLCGPLCEAVTGDSGGQETLQGLERANLFIIPLDDEGVWYRYHHLFGEVLRNRLTASSIKGETNTAEIHRRASDWFEEAGLIDEAIHHALAAPDTERAAVLVERYSMLMMQQSKIFHFRSWLQQLPEELVQTRPRLLLAYGWSLVLTGHVMRLEQWLDSSKARRVLASPDLPAEVLGELTLLRATLARFQRQPDRSLQLAQASLSQLSKDERGFLAGAMYTIGVAHLQKGDIDAARQAFMEAVTLGEAKGGPYMALSALDTLSDIQIRQGHLAQAMQSCQQALDMALRMGWQAMPAVGMTYIHLGRVLYEQNDLEGAAAALTNAVERLRGSIEQYLLAQGYMILAQVQHARGDVNGAFKTIQQGEDWFTQMQVADTGAGILLVLAEVRLWIQQGNLSSAYRWTQACEWRPEDTPLGYLQAVNLIRIRLTQHRHEPAEAFLQEAMVTADRLLAAAEAGAWWGQVIELSLLRALLCQEQRDTTGMLANLDRALTLAEPEGYVRSFLDEGEAMRLALLAYHESTRRRTSDEVDHRFPRLLAYAQKLLTVFSLPTARRTIESGTIVEPLTDREQEILHLLADGFSNREIAEFLVIGLSTVKSHINSLYGKLGTHRRTQAIIIARDQGLLSG